VKLLSKCDAFFEAHSKDVVLPLAILIAGALAYADSRTTTDLLPLNLLPILVSAWYGSANVGYTVAIFSAAIAFLSEAVLRRHVGFDWGHIWTLDVRLFVYMIVAAVVSKLRYSRNQQRELTHFIVHDIRSPVSSAITGLMTLEQTAVNLSETDREMLNLALISNRRALNLVNSILDVAKFETGKMVISKRPVQVSEFLDECATQVQLWANTSGITIKKRISVDEALLDPEVTSRVLVNLLSNSLKFSPSGTTITLAAEPNGRDVIRFAVHDQGPGIPPEFLDRIFEPFAQAKGVKSGTGLGLTFCRLAINAQGGRIWAESTLGKGTSMMFVLPGQPLHEGATKPLGSAHPASE